MPDESSEIAESSTARSSEPVIEELSEPPSPETVIQDPIDEAPSMSMLTAMLRGTPLEQKHHSAPKADQVREEHVLDDSEDDRQIPRDLSGVRGDHSPAVGDTVDDPTEAAPLLSVTSHQSWRSYGVANHQSRYGADLEGQKSPTHKSWARRSADSIHHTRAKVTNVYRVISDPKCWNRRAIWENVVVAPAVCLPAVIVGLLLNILDALSYGGFLISPCTYAQKSN